MAWDALIKTKSRSQPSWFVAQRIQSNMRHAQRCQTFQTVWPIIIICIYNHAQTTEGQVHEDANTMPTITCPSDQSVTAQTGESTATIHWELPAAYDNEDGHLPVTWTPDFHSDQAYPEGTYVITFKTEDSNGAAATCTSRFSVQVHRCPVKFVSSPLHGLYSCNIDNSGQDPVWGTECFYDCDRDYKLEGVNKVTCNDQGNWLDSSGQVVTEIPICQDTRLTITCPSDQNVTAQRGYSTVIVQWNLATAHDYQNRNLSVTWTPDLQSGQAYPDGTYIITFHAQDSFGKTDTCTFTFTVQVNRCSVNFTNNLVHGSRWCTINSTGDPIWGTVCDYQCDPGYQLVGERQLTCQETEEWSNSAGHVVNDPPTCQGLPCGNPIFDTNSMMDYDCAHGYTMGETCVIRCKDGNPPLNSQNITCSHNASAAPGHDMTWTFSGSSAPFCKVGQCPKLTPPKDGALACDYQNGTGEICVPSCNANVMRPPTMKDVYKCFDRTMAWTPEYYIPDCFGRRNPSQPTIVPDFYYYTNTCDPNNRDIIEDFMKSLQNAFPCASGCSDTNDTEITCFSDNSDMGDWLLAISPEISLGSLVDKGNVTDTKVYYDDTAMEMSRALNDEAKAGFFDDPHIGVFNGFGTGIVLYKCEDGMILDEKSLYCAGCGQGHYYESSDGSCQACPVGRYQDQEVAFQCTKCPGNTTTSSIRAKSVHECHEFCSPGTYSLLGYEPCVPCPRGSYQSDSGRTSCDICPYGMSTSSAGRAEKANCQFFDIEMNNETSGPWIQLFEQTPQTFTLVTWVHLTSGSQRTTLTFDIDENEAQSGTAYLALGGIKIFITPTEDLISRKIRNWYHLALIYNHGTTELYIDGHLKRSIYNVCFSELWKETILLVNSNDLRSIVLSRLQMTTTVLTIDDIVSMAYQCDRTVDRNILVANKVHETQVKPSSCDDHDDCTDDVCGHHGTCIDAYQGFTCLCDEEWDDLMCQQPIINFTYPSLD